MTDPIKYLKSVNKLLPQFTAITREEDVWNLWVEKPKLLDGDNNDKYYSSDQYDELEIPKPVQLMALKNGDYEMHEIQKHK